MTRAAPRSPPIYVTPEGRCPYLEGRCERKAVVFLDAAVPALYDDLSRAGFRRSHGVAYRPLCRMCSECVAVRVRARDHRPSRSQRRVLRQNVDLRGGRAPATATEEHHALFSAYLRERHPRGEMAAMGFGEFRAMIEETPVATELFELRGPDGALRAGCLVDVLGDGLSAVYSWFDPAARRRSLGSLVVLRLIAEAARRALPYVYLGYWIDGSPKMAYKAAFQPLEAFGPLGWSTMHAEGRRG